MRYALIKNGKIENIIEAEGYRDSQIIAQSGGFDDAIDVSLYEVGIGDSYVNLQFYKPDGTLAQRGKAPEEEIAEMKQALADTNAMLLEFMEVTLV
ncbi:hypothetical protein UF75_1184 [Desulfosporosinus sp. I2]|uniref:hypothetical protein n=1 Tax=Desulfosporosinus sp. I2 TaxID=1617025 RepID=UPI0005EF42F5|nr:hypothetical protein [Desulfosporosinus sp. I2]KJR48386.1 hypothetical protein UF75_1184 [Desulfosporosinus sp. I2]